MGNLGLLILKDSDVGLGSKQRCTGAGVKQIFRSRIGLGVKFNVKSGVGVGAGVTISLSYYCNVN